MYVILSEVVVICLSYLFGDKVISYINFPYPKELYLVFTVGMISFLIKDCYSFAKNIHQKDKQLKAFEVKDEFNELKNNIKVIMEKVETMDFKFTDIFQQLSIFDKEISFLKEKTEIDSKKSLLHHQFKNTLIEIMEENAETEIYQKNENLRRFHLFANMTFISFFSSVFMKDFKKNFSVDNFLVEFDLTKNKIFCSYIIFQVDKNFVENLEHKIVKDEERLKKDLETIITSERNTKNIKYTEKVVNFICNFNDKMLDCLSEVGDGTTDNTVSSK